MGSAVWKGGNIWQNEENDTPGVCVCSIWESKIAIQLAADGKFNWGDKVQKEGDDGCRQSIQEECGNFGKVFVDSIALFKEKFSSLQFPLRLNYKV